MNIIFVCTGNTCRSPMAEYYLKSKNLSSISVISRGFSENQPANPNSVAVMEDIGIDISAHISHCITQNEAENADLIICMTESHKQLLIQLGIDQNKIIVLSGGIPDPFGGNIETYRNCRDSIIDAIDAFIASGVFDKISVRLADADDIKAIADIEKSVFADPWSENAISESMNATTKFFVAQIGNKIAGYMGLSAVCGEGYVTNVATLKEFRRRGVGTALLDYVIKNEQENLEFISLEVRISNEKAISLYKKFGFEQAGLRKRFYTNPTEDALIMTKRFI